MVEATTAAFRLLSNRHSGAARGNPSLTIVVGLAAVATQNWCTGVRGDAVYSRDWYYTDVPYVL